MGRVQLPPHPSRPYYRGRGQFHFADDRNRKTNHPGLRRARIAARVAAENRGRDIVILDLRELTCMFDFFVLVSGASRRQLHAISEEIDRVLQEELGDRRMGIEGYEESRWILLDYGDVVIHMFEPETRAYYAIEELWGRPSACRWNPSLAPNIRQKNERDRKIERSAYDVC